MKVNISDFNTKYLSKESTNAVKGIFVFLIFMSHFVPYCDTVVRFDNPYFMIKEWLGQTVVTMFFFYSGYGLLESIKKKGRDYVKGLPKNRILKILFHFDLAIVIFLIVNLIRGVEFNLSETLLALFGWESIGNSNWFIFAILVLYIFVYISFMIFKDRTVLAITSVTLMTVAYMIIFRVTKCKDYFWCDTVLCLTLGLWYSYFKSGIERFMMKKNIIYFPITILTVGLTFFLEKFKMDDDFLAGAMSGDAKFFSGAVAMGLAFTLSVVFITMKISVGNGALAWLGKHVFSVYIFQRMPMSIFSQVDSIYSNKYLYFVVSFAATIIIAELFDRMVAELDKKLFPRKISKP
jgi:hypothetical protein